MRLLEVAMTGDTMYKGRASSPEMIPDNAYELRIGELRNHLENWKKSRNETSYDKMMIQKMEDELRDFSDIGEIPFTFYAAKERESAEYFQAQFEDGVIDEVKLYAKNLATVKDLRALGFMKQTISHLSPRHVHELKKAGFDGATGDIDNVGGTEVVVFSPEQVQRV